MSETPRGLVPAELLAVTGGYSSYNAAFAAAISDAGITNGNAQYTPQATGGLDGFDSQDYDGSGTWTTYYNSTTNTWGVGYYDPSIPQNYYS